MNDVSTFQLREIPIELKKWKKVASPHVESYLAEFHAGEEYFIISEAHEDLQSLQSVLDSSKTATQESKLRLSKTIARTMLYLQSLGDDYSHGHLCSSNILVI